jgi:hypothetical protein
MYASLKCSKCGKSAPTELRKHGKFPERMAWVRKHYKKAHPREFKKSIKKGVASRRGS